MSEPAWSTKSAVVEVRLTCPPALGAGPAGSPATVAPVGSRYPPARTCAPFWRVSALVEVAEIFPPGASRRPARSIYLAFSSILPPAPVTTAAPAESTILAVGLGLELPVSPSSLKMLAPAVTVTELFPR